MPVRVAIACPGLGRIQRGFESFSRECFDNLSRESELEMLLLQGQGAAAPHELTVPSFSRKGWPAKLLGAATRRTPYYVEQASFALGMIPVMRRFRPDVIYFSDGTLGNALWRWRRRSGANFKLLLSNGAPFDESFERWDHVQQLTPSQLEVSLRRGVPREKQTLLPYGLTLPRTLTMLSAEERAAIRQSLGLPTDRLIVLSPGTINSSHKRMDYVITEIAKLPLPRPFLVITGERDSETADIELLAENLLGKSGASIRTAAPEQMGAYYQAADAMTLASLSEGFGRVIVEAASAGLPCMVHDYAVPRFILGELGRYAHLQKPGELAVLIQSTLAALPNDQERKKLHAEVYARFAWESLSSEYVAMICRTAQPRSEMSVSCPA